jgi:acyl-CoA hydrolase
MTENQDTIGEETRLLEIVFPNNTNNNHMLFGGYALMLMDRLAFIVSSRYSRKTMVTVATEKVEFLNPVAEGELIELIAKITRVGRTSVTVNVDMFSEHLMSGERKHCTTAQFVMVAVDDEGNPTAISRA